MTREDRRGDGHKPAWVKRVKGIYYWAPSSEMRRAGFPNTSLGKDQEKAFKQAWKLNTAWAAWKDRHEVRPPREDLSSVIAAFKDDPVEFGRLAPKTGAEAEKAFGRIEPTLGKVLVKDTDFQIGRALYKKWCTEASVSIANKIHKWLVWVLTYAVQNGQIPHHPLLGMKKLQGPKRKARWTRAEVAAVYREAMRDGLATSGNAIPKRPSVAYALQLAYDSSQRMGDILALRWNQFDGEGITVEQSKKNRRGGLVPTQPQEP